MEFWLRPLTSSPDERQKNQMLILKWHFLDFSVDPPDFCVFTEEVSHLF